MATNNWRAARPRDSFANLSRSIAVLAVLVCAAADIAESSAQTVRQWTGPSGGNWYSGANWTPSAVPSVSDRLYLNGSGDSASTTTGISTYFGGVIDVDNSASLSVGGSLNIGGLGEGTLDVHDAADVAVNDNFYVGNGGPGIARFQGAGTTLGVALDTFVGINGGRGTLDITQEAVVDYAGVAFLGNGLNSDGSVRVDTGGEFNSLSLVPLTIGSSGTGSLEIQGGGSASSTGATLASGATGSGQVIVDGGGSLWDIDIGANGLLIGFAGTATMDVTAGGRVESNEAFLGHTVGSSGNASVRGSGSEWNVAGMLTIGNGDNGDLQVAAGGEVVSQGGVVASGANAAGSSAEVRGAESHWNVGGDLVVGSSGMGSLLVEGGALVESTGNSTRIANTSTAANSTVTVTGGGSKWYHGGSILVGNSGVGRANVTGGGAIESAAVQLGANSSGTGVVTLDGAGSRWESSSTFIVGFNGDATLNVSGGARLTSNSGTIAYGTTSVATATVGGAGSEWSTVAALTVGKSGKGSLTVSDGGHVDVGTSTSVGPLGTLTIDGGSLSTQSLTTLSGGFIDFESGTVTVDGGAFNPGGAFTLSGSGGTATLNLQGGGNSTVGGDLNVGFTGPAELSVASGHTLAVAGNLTVKSLGQLTLDGGSLSTTGANFTIVSAGGLDFRAGTLNLSNTGSVDVADGLVVPSAGVVNLGTDVISPVASLPGSVITVTQSGTSLGSIGSREGVDLNGRLNVGSYSVTLNSADPARLGTSTTVYGGTIIAPNGVALGDGDSLLGWGTVASTVAATAGSSIVLSDNSELGDAAEFDGFASEGNLWVDFGTVTLHDRNQAVLGTLTTLSSDATIDAANGLVVDFGDAVEGFGTLDTPDDPAKPTIINGHVEGDSPGNAIALSGYVKGVGTFNNVLFSGTHAPGFSPAAVAVGSVAYDNAATLEIELGGTIAGTKYDQVNAAGNIVLDGTLDVSLINGFTPSNGDVFDILTAAGAITGTFDTELLPALAGGLALDVLYGTNNVSLVVGLAGDYNFDGAVDAADYTVWRDMLGQSGPGLAADGNGDNAITEADYDLWKANYGATAGSGSGSITTAAVPEPTSLVLVLLGSVLSLASCRRTIV